MKTKTKILGGLLIAFLAAMPFAAMRVLAVDDTTPPTAPTNLAASLNASNQVALSWTASTDDVGVVGYKIMRNSSLTANATTTNYLDLNTATSTTYAYSVLAFDAMGNVSSSSPQISITTAATSTDTTLPSTPANLVATAASSTQINLTWTASTDNVGVTGYNVYKDGFWLASTASTTYSSIGLTPSTAYTFFVRAYDASANLSAQSNSVTVSTLATESNSDTVAPTAPTDLAGTAASSTQINLKWNASTDNVGVTGYNVYKNNVWLASTTSMTYSSIGLTPSTAYTFTVRAYDAKANISALSNAVTVTTLAAGNIGIDAIAPTTPTNLAIVATTTNSVKLSWTASTDNVGVAGYSIYRNGNWLKISTTNSFTDTGINPLNGYTYYVRAYDEAGNVSGQSNHVSTSLLSPTFENDVIAPSVPTDLKVNNTSLHAIKLSWTASTDNVEVIGYNVYRNGEWLASIDHATTFGDSGLNAGTTYTYYVRAYDMRGNMSAQSNIVTGTTLGSNSDDDDDDDNGNVNDDNIYQHKNNGNNGNHYGQLKNGNNGKHLGQDRDNDQNRKNGKNKNR